MSEEQLVHLSPEAILADDNSRFALKPVRVETLASSILELGGVQTPIEVEPLSPAVNGHKYRLISGFYRHAAVAKLNEEQKAGLTLPALVRKPDSPVDRLRRQVSENKNRENLSPMDEAVAIKKFLDQGVPRQEVRRIFARLGGRKGNTVSPASNAWLNITLRLLEMPKAIQEKIHDGRVSFAAAYELGRVPPDKRSAVLERAESERMRQVELEEKDEEKYLQAEQKLVKAQTEAKEAEGSVETVKAEIDKVSALLGEKSAVLKELQKAPYLSLDDKGKAELKEKLQAAQADVKGAEKVARDKKNELAKLLGKAKSAAEVAEEQKAKLEAARKAVKSKSQKGRQKGEGVGPTEIKKAAKEEGVDAGLIVLGATEMRQAIEDLARQKDYPRVALIGKAVKGCFNGKETPKMLIYQLAVLTGEVQPNPAPGKPAPATAAKK